MKYMKALLLFSVVILLLAVGVVRLKFVQTDNSAGKHFYAKQHISKGAHIFPSMVEMKVMQQPELDKSGKRINDSFSEVITATMFANATSPEQAPTALHDIAKGQEVTSDDCNLPETQSASPTQ